MDIEAKALINAGIVWLAFMASGLTGKPIKISGTIAIGGGFLLACIALILAKIFFENGLWGLVVFLGCIWVLWSIFNLVIKSWGRD